ncbi:hypothetical protein [Phytoactinopolyspora halotolerans]|uniref:Uncharacterized protein n=1 Tax=Phytoactinopolyspora halotolerans TaxID=1981512 RepID=A0A6L9SDN4_9ACTN|nr:hypothetical protein [Phytoactinopolyspora halotolerans]NEE03386.1 hypothetical protein [Phytoactinopolyspora halotolerans]
MLALATVLMVCFTQLTAVVSSPTASAQTTYFNDDFEAGDATRWTPLDGSWSVVDDGAGGKVYQQGESRPDQASYAVAGDGGWGDYNLAAEITPGDLGAGAAGLIARYQDGSNYYAARVSDDQLELTKTVDGVQSTLESAPIDLVDAPGLLLEIEVRSDYVKVYVNHNLVVSSQDSALDAGRVGLGTWNAAAAFDDVRVSKPIELGVMRANLQWYERYFVDTFQNNMNRWTRIGDWELVPREIENGQDDNNVVEASENEDGRDPLAWSAWDSSIRTDTTTRVTVIPVEELDGDKRASVMFRLVNRWNYYAVHINSTTVTLERKVSNASEVIAEAPLPEDVEIEPGTPLYVDIDAYGPDIDVYLDHTAVLSASDSTFTEGRVGLGTRGTNVHFDDVETHDKFDQFALLDEMKDNGMNRARLTYTRYKYLRLVSEWVKHANEIDLDVLMSFSFTGDPQYYPKGTEKVFGSIAWGAYRLSDIDPHRFARAYRTFLKQFRDSGAQLTEVGFGNEMNWFGFNGDLREVDGPKIFDLDTDISDPEFAQVREGIEKYGQLLAQARHVTDSVNRIGDVQLVSGGVNHPDTAGIMENGRVHVRPELFLTLLQGTHRDQPANAPDYLSAMDQIGVHLYPFQNGGRSYDTNPDTAYATTVEFVTEIMDPIIAAIGSDYTFLIAEAGAYRRDAITLQGEQITEEQRLELYRTFVRALQDPALSDVNFGTIMMYSFDDGPWAAYDDGKLLPVGEVFAEYPY